jgi:twitching motility protein PilT
VPECEILMATHAVKNFVRNRDFFKLSTSLETGAEHGMWTYQRYRNWLDTRTNWSIPGQTPEPSDNEPAESPAPASPALPAFLSTPKTPRPEKSAGLGPGATAKPGSTRIEIEPTEGEFGKILKRPGE